VGAPGITLSSALQEAALALAPTSPSARLDAEALLMHILQVGRPALITRASEAFDGERYGTFVRMLARRLAGEPIAYITGVREFWSLPIHVTPKVLIPRPETELLVECALTHVARDADSRVADLGTGSGAVAAAIAHERPRCQVVGTDASIDALKVARDNTHRLGLANVTFRFGDWLTPLAGEHFDVITANPPYLRSDDPHLLQGDVRFEPRAALVSGRDGLAAIRRIAADAPARLHRGGWLVLEHGYDQAEAVAEILKNARMTDVTSHRDLAGHVRITEARASVLW